MTQDTETMLLQLNELTPGKHHFGFQLNDAYFQGIEKSEILGGTVAVEADLNLLESDYTLHICAQGKVRLTCDRCLAPMTCDIDVEDDILPEEGSETEVNADTLDLGWLVYELITINLPLVHSHPEGECMPDMQQLLQTHLCSTVDDPDSCV